MRADEPLHPDVAGAAVDFDLGDLGDDGLAAVRVGDTTWFRKVAGAANGLAMSGTFPR